jgi:hypothetical protein
MRVPPRLLALILAAMTCVPAFAQNEAGAQRHQISLWGAASFANGHAFGFVQNATLAFAKVRYGRTFFEWHPLAFKYVVEAVPLALMGEARPGGGRNYIYGGGLSPIGLQLNLLRRRRVQPMLASNGGFLYFTRPVPTADAARFNFTVFIAGGAEIFLNRSRAITIGYQYHHFSNANMTRNPALDNHMIFAGFSFLR